MIFFPVNPGDPKSEFLKFENGIQKAHSDVTRETNSDQSGGGQPATRPESK
jgi:hypothetical protein